MANVQDYALPILSYTGLAGTTAGVFHLLGVSTASVGLVGWGVALPVVMILSQVKMHGGTGVAKAMGGKPGDAKLQSLVRHAASAVGVPEPQAYEINTREPNAFAASGFGTKSNAVAVTSGLREILSESELGAVLAHEMGHLRHRDVVRNMHVAAAAAGLGGIYEIGRMILRSDMKREKKKKKDKDEGSAATVGLMLMAGGLVTQTAAHGLRLMASRDHELKADRAAAEVYGAETLISALQKIDKAAARRPADLREKTSAKAYAHAMISDGPSAMTAQAASNPGPFHEARGFLRKIGEYTRTHPTMEKRVAALEKAAADGLVPQRAITSAAHPAGAGWRFWDWDSRL